MKLMFVGYSKQHKACKMVDIATNKVAYNIDVIVDENAGIFSSF